MQEIKDSRPLRPLQGWQGAANDPGAFGKEVHARVSSRLIALDPAWKADIYVNPTTKQILSIGGPPAGGIPQGTVQVDIVRAKNGQNIAVGGAFDPAKIDDLVEIKTSIGGTVSEAPKLKLKGLMNGGDIVVTEGTSRKWTPAKGWYHNPKFKNVFRLLSLFGVASAAWNIIHVDSYDDELNAIVARAKFIHDRAYTSQQGGLDQKRLDLIDLQTQITDYMKHFSPDNTALNFIQLATTYHILDMDFSETP